MRVAVSLGCCLFWFAVGSVRAADPLPTLEERARAMREAREAIETAQVPDKERYQRYFDVFPGSFRDLGELLHSGKYRSLLLRTGEQWDFGNAYKVPMCMAYRYLDHRQYMRKLLRIGVEAGNWGGSGKDPQRYLYPGEDYKRLVWGDACEVLTETSAKERMSVIYALTPEFSDSEIEAIFNSLSWEDLDRVPIEWFLAGVCAHHADRCALTNRLHDKYIKSSEPQTHSH